MSDGEAIASLGEVANEPIAQSGPPAEGTFIYVDIGSVDKESKTIGETKEMPVSDAPSRAKQLLREGDVLVSMTRPNLNAVAIVPPQLAGAICSTGFHVLRTHWMEPRFLYYLVQTSEFVEAMTSVVQGALYPAVRPADIDRFQFRLPPRAEQTRIVEKLEALLANLDAGVAELKAAQRKLAQYRQSLLKAAVEGALTAGWRAAHTPEESGERLLQRILQERRARFVQKHGSKKKYKEPVAPDVSQLPELPEGWVWATLDQTVAESLVGLDRGQEHQTSTGAYGYIKMNNVSMSGEVDTSNLVRVDAGDEEFIRYEVRVNDLLFNTRNSKDLVGKVGLVHTLNSRTTYNNNLMRLRFDGVLLPEFACYQMCGPEFRSRMEKIKRATTSVAAVYAKDLFPLAIAVPPIAEQHAILAQLDTVLAACKQQEQAIAHGLTLAAAQRRNLLRAAFAGQLVPQDPNDEPASELLTRIRAERAGSTGKTGSRTRRPGQLTSTNT